MSTYTVDEVQHAADEAVFMINGAATLTESQADLVNLLINATLTLLETPTASLADIVEENYQESVEKVIGWIQD